MKAANRRLIVSIAALVVALALTTTATFAWFSINSKPTVTGINMTVATQNNLLISLSGAEGTYYPSIDISELPDEERERFNNIKLAPLTPVTKTAPVDDPSDVFTKYLQDMDGVTAATIDGNYLELDIFFRAGTSLAVRYDNQATTLVENSSNAEGFTAWRDFAANELFPGSPAILKGRELKDFPTVATASSANAARLGFTQYDLTRSDDLLEITLAEGKTQVYNPVSGKGFSDPKYTLGQVESVVTPFHAAHDHYETVTRKAIPANMREENPNVQTVDTFGVESQYVNYVWGDADFSGYAYSDLYKRQTIYAPDTTVEAATPVASLAGYYYVDGTSFATEYKLATLADYYTKSNAIGVYEDVFYTAAGAKTLKPTTRADFNAAQTTGPAAGKLYVKNYQVVDTDAHTVDIVNNDYYSGVTYIFEQIDPGAYLNITGDDDTIEDVGIANQMYVLKKDIANLLILQSPNANSDYYEGMLRIRVWIEGTDPDAFEEILGNTLSLTLQFIGTMIVEP